MGASSRCPEPDKLRAYALGEDVGPDTARIESHLDECNSCQATLQNLGAAHPTEAIGRGRSVPRRPDTTDNIDFLLPAVLPDEIGRLANYRVLKVLGSGGMGIVFLAEDISLLRRVALKVMRPELHENPDGWKRFLREARTMAAIKHDHLVTIYQAGQERDVIYFAMELLDGESLDGWMERNPRPSVSDVVRIGKELAQGLAVLHLKGLIHRDIKPANIWLESHAGVPGAGKDGAPPAPRVKILDLGLVRTAEEDARVTRTGMVIGTPAFMSPEQARGIDLDARTDLFSLGSVLYNLCTGRAPFEGNSSTAVLMALAADDPPIVSDLNPEIPRSLSDLIMQLLHRQPAKRPATAQDVLQRLSAIEKEASAPIQRTEAIRKPARAKKSSRSKLPPPKASKLPWFIAAGAGLFVMLIALVVAVLATSGWFSRQPAPPQRPVPIDPANPAAVLGERVYLADLVPSTREHWPFVLGGPEGKEGKGPDGKKKKDKKEGKEKDKDNPPPPPPPDAPVRYLGKGYPKGIFMHPPVPPNEGEPTSLSYNIAGKGFRTFQGLATLNDGPEVSESSAHVRGVRRRQVALEIQPRDFATGNADLHGQHRQRRSAQDRSHRHRPAPRRPRHLDRSARVQSETITRRSRAGVSTPLPVGGGPGVRGLYPPFNRDELPSFETVSNATRVRSSPIRVRWAPAPHPRPLSHGERGAHARLMDAAI